VTWKNYVHINTHDFHYFSKYMMGLAINGPIHLDKLGQRIVTVHSMQTLPEWDTCQADCILQEGIGSGNEGVGRPRGTPFITASW
jgi:hypothetical protein